MAKTYLDIQNSAYTVGNIMDWTNALTRLSGVPVDITEVYDSYDKAVEYAATNPVAYEGQLITVTENGDTTVYVITPAVQGTHIVGEGDEAVTYNVNIKKVGIVPSGDNASITVTEAGLVSIFGFASAEDGKLPMKVNGAIQWKSLEDIGAGDGNDNTTYTFEANAAGNGIIVTPLFNGQPIYDGEGEDAPQIKYEVALDVYTKAEADEKFLAKADYTPYDDKALSDRVKALEDEERYDETPLANRVTAVETAIGNEESGLVKDIADNATAIATEKSRAEGAEAQVLEDAKTFTTEQIAGIDVAIEKKDNVDYLVIKNASGEEVASVDATPFIKDGMLDSAEYNTDTKKLTLTWNTDAGKQSTEIDLNGLVDTYTGGTGITVGTDGVISVDDTIATVEALNGVKATAEAAQTAEQVAQAIATAIADYAKTTDVEGALALKADKTDLDNYYTKDEVEGKGYAVATEVGATYATKEELEQHAETAEGTYAKAVDVNAELAKKIETATIAHSTESIAEGVTVDGTALNIVVDAYTKAETLTKIQEKITEINGGESAGEVLGQLNSYIETNDARVGAIETSLSADGATGKAIAAAQTQADKGVADAKTANDAITALTNGQVATNTTDINTVKSRLTNLESTSGTHSTDIANAQGAITALQSADTTINEKIGTIEGNITTLTNKDSEIDGVLATKANAAEVYSKTEIDGKVSTINEAINAKADQDTTYTKDEVDNLLANLDQSEIIADIEANTNAIAALVGDDTGKSVREIAANEINTLIGAANSEDTITNINSLITYVNDNAGDIAALTSAVESNTNKLAGIDGTVSDAISNAIAAIVMPKASTEVTIAEDGTLGLGVVDVSKLVVADGDTFVINGGNA